MISKEKSVIYNSWKLSLIIITITSLGLLLYKYLWALICLGGGIISILLITLDVKMIEKSEINSPFKKALLMYSFRYIIYVVYMLIMFLVFTPYEVIPSAIGLSIPRLCIIIYSLIKGGEEI